MVVGLKCILISMLTDVCKNDTNPAHSFGYCHSCVQRLPYFDKYPELKSVLSLESISRVEALKKPSLIGKVAAVCESCKHVNSIDLLSLTKQYVRNKSRERSSIYRCHTCSKEGESKIRIDSVLHVIDLESTNLKYGGIPDNVKKGFVVAICESCKSINDVKLSSILHHARRHKKDGRSVIYNCQKCGNSRQDVVAKNTETRLKQQKLGFKPGLEIAVENRLKILSLRYECQFPVGMYLWDYFLPDYNLLVEVNGEYWHSLPQNAAKDKSKQTYASKYHPEYKQLVIPEVKLLNPNSIDSLILTAIGESAEIKQRNFDFSSVSIRLTPLSQSCTQFLDSYHYAKSGRNSKRIYSAYLDGELIAVAKFSPVTRKESASRLNLKCNEIFELDRLCIHPQFHKKNFASWFLSRTLKSFFKDNPSVRTLISFADPNFGHVGTVYEASNWVKDGKTKVSYHYIDKTGFHINKKRVYDIASKLRMTEESYASKHQLEKFRDPPKSRYLYHKK